MDESRTYETVSEIMDADSGTEIGEQDLLVEKDDGRNETEDLKLERRELDEESIQCNFYSRFFCQVNPQKHIMSLVPSTATNDNDSDSDRKWFKSLLSIKLLETHTIAQHDDLGIFYQTKIQKYATFEKKERIHWYHVFSNCTFASRLLKK